MLKVTLWSVAKVLLAEGAIGRDFRIDVQLEDGSGWLQRVPARRSGHHCRRRRSQRHKDTRPPLWEGSLRCSALRRVGEGHRVGDGVDWRWVLGTWAGRRRRAVSRAQLPLVDTPLSLRAMGPCAATVRCDRWGTCVLMGSALAQVRQRGPGLAYACPLSWRCIRWRGRPWLEPPSV